jgi:hypothetical protein
LIRYLRFALAPLPGSSNFGLAAVEITFCDLKAAFSWGVSLKTKSSGNRF